MTDEQLEKQISEEFEKWWYKPLHDSMNIDGKFDKDLFRYKDLGKQSAQQAYFAAALPLMKKIEEKDTRIVELDNTWRELYSGVKDANLYLKGGLFKLQKENEELRSIIGSFNEYRLASDRGETSKKTWHTFERILYDRIRLYLDKEGGK